MASTLFITNAWRFSKIAKPLCAPCCSTRNLTGILLKTVGQEVGFEEKGNSLERKIDVTKLVMNESEISSGEGRAFVKKAKGKTKNVKGKPDHEAPVGGKSQKERERSSRPAKLHSSKSTPAVTKTDRNSVVIFPAGKVLPNPSELQGATLSQEIDKSVLQSGDTDNTQKQTIYENLSLSAEGEEVFSDTPSILGISTSGRDWNVQQLLKAGFSEIDARFVFPYLPLCLENNFGVAHRVVSLLEKHKLNWKLLLKQNAVCFTVEPTHLEANLQALSNAGITKKRTQLLLQSHPILFVSPLRKSVMDICKQAKEAGLGHHFLEMILRNALTGNPPKVKLRSDLKELVGILKQIKINPGLLLMKCPAFFSMNASLLQGLIQVMSSKPFYMDGSLVRLIVKRVPHVLITIQSLEELKAHLNSLHSIMTQNMQTKSVYYMFVNVPSLINPFYNVEERLEVFKAFGFSLEDFCSMVWKANTILTQDVEAIRIRLELCLQLQGATPSSVAGSIRGISGKVPLGKESSSKGKATAEEAVCRADPFPQTKSASVDVKEDEELSESTDAKPFKVKRFRYLTRPVEEMQARIDFTRLHNAQLLTVDRIHDLFGTSSSDFSKLFNLTTEDFLNAMKQKKILNEDNHTSPNL